MHNQIFLPMVPSSGRFACPRDHRCKLIVTRGTQPRFPPKYIASTFYRLSWVLLGIYYVEMYSKRRYKICICSVILGERESFRNYQGFSSIFPKVWDAIEHIEKERIFLILLCITILSPKILRFLFSRRKKPNPRGDLWKIKLQKIVGNLL